MKRKIWPIAVLTLIAILIVVSLVNSYWETLPYSTYKIGDEIKGFPIEEISITFTNFSISPDINFPETSKDVTFNVTIKNLASYSLFFNQSDVQTKFDQVSSKQLYLKYETKKGFGETSAWNFSDWWGITILGFQKNGFNWLSPDESVNGSIRFVLGDNSYTSFQLVCRSSLHQKPLFVVNLTQ
jgi:hypothetical protein